MIGPTFLSSDVLCFSFSYASSMHLIVTGFSTIFNNNNNLNLVKLLNVIVQQLRRAVLIFFLH